MKFASPQRQKVLYDQNEEILAAIHKLKLEEKEKDKLESWCEHHPDDPECRIYCD